MFVWKEYVYLPWFRSIHSVQNEPPRLLSRGSNVKVTTDVRGNLGPPSVLNQEIPGKNWLKDRWQAASDMHGTAIKGAHWVTLEFPYPVIVSHIVLDWEAAFSKDYKIEGSMIASIDSDAGAWFTLFDTKADGIDPSPHFQSKELGQSPGVKNKVPLHIIHEITCTNKGELRQLRVWIRSSAHGWGVSLWQVDVHGWQ